MSYNVISQKPINHRPLNTFYLLITYLLVYKNRIRVPGSSNRVLGSSNRVLGSKTGSYVKSLQDISFTLLMDSRVLCKTMSRQTGVTSSSAVPTDKKYCLKHWLFQVCLLRHVHYHLWFYTDVRTVGDRFINKIIKVLIYLF